MTSLALRFLNWLLFGSMQSFFEPQHILEVHNMAVAANRQLTFGTPVAPAAYVERTRNPGTAFATWQKTYYSDEQLANKGHQFPTVRQVVEQQSSFDATFDLNAFISGWLLAFSLGADTVTGVGPFTHTFKWLQTTNQAPVTSLLMQDTNDVWYQFPDMAINDLVFTGKEMNPISAQFKMVGSGQKIEGVVPLPPLNLPAYLLGSDADILVGPSNPAAPVLATAVSGAQAQRTEFFRLTWNTAQGETTAGAEASILVPANSVAVITPPAAPPGVLTYNVYGSTASGTETRQVQGVALNANWQEPAAGLIAGAAMPADTTALLSIKERVREWTVHIAPEMVPHRAPGGGLIATFMKVLKQRATFTVQIAAKDVDDIRTLYLNDTMRNVRFRVNSGPAAQMTLDFPAAFVTAQLQAQGVEAVWQVNAGDQDVIKWNANEPFQATVINNVAAYMVGA